MPTSSQTPPVEAPPPSDLPFYQQLDPWLGFLGWYILNGMVWQWIYVPYDHEQYTLNSVVTYVITYVGQIGAMLLINIIVLLSAYFIRRRLLAGGMLTAIALNFVIAIPSGLLVNAVCAIPFFVR